MLGWRGTIYMEKEVYILCSDCTLNYMVNGGSIEMERVDLPVTVA